MKDIDNNNIGRYIERFLAGETTVGEEQAIYDYFRRPDVPAEYEQYREMFAWYGSLSTGERQPEPIRLPRWRWWQWTGVAATVALLLTAGFVFRSQTEALPDEYMAYEGSYIIRDGKKITDLRVVVPEIMRSERLVSERLQQIDRSFEEVDQAFDRALTDDFDMSNPAMAEVVEASLRY